jgi:hypothetical protein
MEKTLIMLQWQRRSTLLTQEEEAIIVAFRKHTLLPLDEFSASNYFSSNLL